MFISTRTLGRMEYTIMKKIEPLDLTVKCVPVWTHSPNSPPLRVPAAWPSPEWTQTCRPHPYPIDIIQPIELPQQFSKFENSGSLSDDPEFHDYKKDALHIITERNGRSLVGHNPRMRRSVQTQQDVDEPYRRRRERNNMAAKQSRDRRKLREFHSSLKVGFLKKKLAEVKALLSEMKCKKCKRLG